MFDWLFRKSSFYRYQDSYAFNDQALAIAIKEAIIARSDLDETVLLLAHFPERLSELQATLEGFELPFVIGTKQLNESELLKIRQEAPGQPILTLSGMLYRAEQKTIRKEEPCVAMMVAERHPLPHHDDELKLWGQSLPFPVQLGYFLSLDDPVVSYAINDQVKQLLSQFGMGENELVTSNLVSRRVDRVLRRLAKNGVGEVACESSTEWMKANFPDSL